MVYILYATFVPDFKQQFLLWRLGTILIYINNNIKFIARFPSTYLKEQNRENI